MPSTVGATAVCEVMTVLPPSCARCGAPLPAVAADPKHPEWCAACAARALGEAGPSMPPAAPSPGPVAAPPAGPPPGFSSQPAMAPPVPPMPDAAGRSSAAAWSSPPTAMVANAPGRGLVVKMRPFDGLLVGVAAAGVGAAIWWAIAAFTDIEQWSFLAVIIGLFVGQGVLIGARRGGAVPAVLALVISSAAVLVAVYFITHSFQVQSVEDAGRTLDVPLWQGAANAKDLVWGWVDGEPSKAAAWLLAPVVAVAMTVWPKARPLVR